MRSSVLVGLGILFFLIGGVFVYLLTDEDTGACEDAGGVAVGDVCIDEDVIIEP